MFILRDLLKPLQNVFPDTDNGRERFVWFAYTMVAIFVPVTSARSSNLFAEPVRFVDFATPLLHLHGLTKDALATYLALPVGSHPAAVYR